MRQILRTVFAVSLAATGCGETVSNATPDTGVPFDDTIIRDAGLADATTVPDDLPDVQTGDDIAMDSVVTTDTGPPPCITGLDCDDGNPCTWQDQCLDGLCIGTGYSCDDDRPCTEDTCDGDGGCLFTVTLGYCLIGNQCLDHATPNANNSCQRCDTDENRIGWSDVNDLAPCTDGNECTFGDYCTDGTCTAGLATTCDDQNSCTLDNCDPSSGCVHVPTSGTCDDGDKCTEGEVCSGGVCQATTTSCDDDNPCTTDTCLADLGCEHVPFNGPCEDGNACTTNEDCDAGSCGGGVAINCDDGQLCTFDQCDPEFGCWYELNPSPCCVGAVSLCDDGDPCTLDDCDSSTFACQNTVATLPCSDGDPCTVGDFCVNGACESGNTASCNDGNPCTLDSCDPAAGCQNTANLGACDDGISCTTGDTCIAGECIGDASECQCAPVFSTTAAKATSLQLLGDGMGLDVDQNMSTCSPQPCSNGIDNSLAGLAGLLNPTLQDELDSGALVLLLELVNPTLNGSLFDIRLYAGRTDGSGCNVQLPGCSFLIDSATLDDDCEPLVNIDNAQIINGKLSAGGPTYNFPIQLPLFGGVYLDVPLYFGTITGDITVNGDDVTIENGLLGGAIPKQTFVSAIEFVPESQLPVPKAAIVQLLDLVVVNDVDTLPPVGADAASIGMSLTALPTTITGVAD